MARGLVLGHEALGNGSVNCRHGRFVSGFSFWLVAGGNGFHYVLDRSAYVGAQAGIVLAVLFRLTSTFAS